MSLDQSWSASVLGTISTEANGQGRVSWLQTAVLFVATTAAVLLASGLAVLMNL